MTPRWTVYSVIEDVRDEETLNDCFADLLEDSLVQGPEFLNFVLDGLVQFEAQAELVATDRDPLPYRPNGTDRKIDFTVADSEKLVGFESKRRDSLKRTQLNDELEKLRFNADGRDTILVALTEDLRHPSLIHGVSDDIVWKSWFKVAQRTFAADRLDLSWQPTVSRAQKMFREFGYTEFDGIDTEEFQVGVWEFWKQLAIQADGLETGKRWPNNLLSEVANQSKGYRPIDPDWMLLTFGDEPGNTPKKTSYCILSNRKTCRIWVGVCLCPWGNETLTDYLCDHAEVLADRVVEAELDVIQFPLNWLVGRKNLPERHRKAVRESYPSTSEELRNAFSDRAGMENDGANRFVIAHEVDRSDALTEAVDILEGLQELFGDEREPSLDAFISSD